MIMNNSLNIKQALSPNRIVGGMRSDFTRQALVNGNFNIWQRGVTGTNIGNGIYLADRWKIASVLDGGTLPANIINSRQPVTAGDIDGSFYYYRINPDGAGSGFGVNAEYYIMEHIEHAPRLLAGTGNKLTVSLKAKSDISNKKIGICLITSYGTGGSPSAVEVINGANLTLTSSLQTLTHTFDLNTIAGKTFGTNNDDHLQLRIYTMWGSTVASRVGDGGAEDFVGSGNIDIAQVKVAAGSVALDFKAKAFNEELAECQRYYQKSFSYITAAAQSAGLTGAWSSVQSVGAGAGQHFGDVRFARPMRAAPTMTLYNPSAANAEMRNTDQSADASATTAENIGDAGFSVQATTAAGSAAGERNYLHWAADSDF